VTDVDVSQRRRCHGLLRRRPVLPEVLAEFTRPSVLNIRRRLLDLLRQLRGAGAGGIRRRATPVRVSSSSRWLRRDSVGSGGEELEHAALRLTGSPLTSGDPPIAQENHSDNARERGTGNDANLR